MFAVLGVIPREGQAVVFDEGCREAGGCCRRVVLHPLGYDVGPGAAGFANRAVCVVVTGTHLDLVAVARRQVIERERGDAGERIFVAPFCFVGRVVGRES